MIYQIKIIINKIFPHKRENKLMPRDERLEYEVKRFTHLHGFPVDIWDIIRLYTLQPVSALMVAKAPFITFLNS